MAKQPKHGDHYWARCKENGTMVVIQIYGNGSSKQLEAYVCGWREETWPLSTFDLVRYLPAPR